MLLLNIVLWKNKKSIKNHRTPWMLIKDVMFLMKMVHDVAQKEFSNIKIFRTKRFSFDANIH